jgi:hypothetical protein
LVGLGVTFPLIMAGWIPFRCQSVSEALVMWGKLLNPGAYRSFGLAPNSYFVALAMTICVLVTGLIANVGLPWFKKQIQSPFIGPLTFSAQVLSFTLLIMFDFVFLEAKTQFIYFQF